MKTFKLVGMALLAIMMSFSLAACSDDDDEFGNATKETLVGEWQQTWSKGYDIYDGEKDEWDEASTYYHIVFNEDGTGYDYEADEPGYKDDFTWQLNGENITITYMGGKPNVGKIKMSGKTMTLELFEEEDGETYYEFGTYKKIK